MRTAGWPQDLDRKAAEDMRRSARPRTLRVGQVAGRKRADEIANLTRAALATPTPQEQVNRTLERRISAAAGDSERVQVQAAIRGDLSGRVAGLETVVLKLANEVKELRAALRPGSKGSVQ